MIHKRKAVVFSIVSLMFLLGILTLIPISTKNSGCMVSKRFSFVLGQKNDYDHAKAHYPGPLEGACALDDGRYKLYIL